MCAQTKAACAFAQSDRSLRCSHDEHLHPLLFKMHPVKILITLWMHRLIWIFAGCTCLKVPFLTLRFIYCAQRGCLTIVQADTLAGGLDRVYLLQGEFSRSIFTESPSSYNILQHDRPLAIAVFTPGSLLNTFPASILLKTVSDRIGPTEFMSG